MSEAKTCSRKAARETDPCMYLARCSSVGLDSCRANGGCDQCMHSSSAFIMQLPVLALLPVCIQLCMQLQRCTMHDARCMMHDARCTGTIPSHFATTLSISAGPSGCDVLAWEVDEVASPRMQHVAILASIYASNDGWLLHHLPASPCLLTCCSSGRAVLHALSSRS